mgnify:CR=1 FL=1
MVDLKNIPMNKATMALATLADAAAMGVVMFWSLITLIVISKTESTSTYKGMVGFYFFLAIITLLMVIAAFIVLLRTRDLASPKNWMIIQICVSVCLTCVLIGLISARFSMLTTFLFSMFGLIAMILARFFVGKYMNDAEVNPDAATVRAVQEDYAGEPQSAYQPPAAVDSQVEPAMSSVESQEGAFSSDSAAIL